MAQHKWHKEIKAWADGAEIEVKERYVNHNYETGWFEEKYPKWDDETAQFRIKPQPKEPMYLYVTYGVNGIKFHRDRQYQEHCSQYNLGKIKLETDDE